MAGRDDPFTNARAQRLVLRFESLSASLPIMPSARKLIEDYFYKNYRKFALQNDQERLLRHWEDSFEVFENELRLVAQERVTIPPSPIEIEDKDMAAAIRRSAERLRSRDPAIIAEKIPPPVF
jgi:hypothetical protein